ncbi:MAG: 4Fe-4S binding protein [Bacteroidales bacterium]|nr:4Fe-4S binding protein [Bacteroidales bacterium]
MLKKLRIAVASLTFTLITLLFLDVSGMLHLWFGWLAKIQFLPAVLALNVGVIAALLLLTFIFGRLYCSIICPLGIMQDIFAWGGRKQKKNRYSYSKAHTVIRICMLAGMIIAVFLGIAAFTTLFAPYSAYGRIASAILAPIYGLGNNLLAWISAKANSYAFYPVDVQIKGWLTFVVAAATLIILAVLAWRNGRTYCNTICPVGTVLGYISKFSILKPVIDTNKCNGCQKCARNCKASCIDSNAHKIDYTRCVMCFDCIDNCKQNAISYTACKSEVKNQSSSETGTNGRRAFLAVSALFAVTAAKAQNSAVKMDGGLATILDKKVPKRQSRIVPAGAKSLVNLSKNCTACQLCVSTCPNNVLRPSQQLDTFMQPEASFEKGYCRPECVKCSEVCPAGAIEKISIAEKSSIQVGHAVWIQQNCIVERDGVQCDNCSRHCPVGAILMVRKDPSNRRSLMIPTVDESRCIGCGACENLCPSRPFSAMYIEGHQVHKYI